MLISEFKTISAMDSYLQELPFPVSTAPDSVRLYKECLVSSHLDDLLYQPPSTRADHPWSADDAICADACALRQIQGRAEPGLAAA